MSGWLVALSRFRMDGMEGDINGDIVSTPGTSAGMAMAEPLAAVYEEFVGLCGEDVVRLRCICVRRLERCFALMLVFPCAPETSIELPMLLCRVRTVGWDGAYGCDEADPDLDRPLLFGGEADIGMVEFSEFVK